jgi:hypothetical protein
MSVSRVESHTFKVSLKMKYLSMFKSLLFPHVLVTSFYFLFILCCMRKGACTTYTSRERIPDGDNYVNEIKHIDLALNLGGSTYESWRGFWLC